MKRNAPGQYMFLLPTPKRITIGLIRKKQGQCLAETGRNNFWGGIRDWKYPPI